MPNDPNDIDAAAPPPASLRLRVDHGALAANWRLLDAASGAARAGAAVKADAYGLGARGVVPALRAAGCESFFVAHWAEAAAIRDLVPAGQIAVLHGPLTPAEAQYCRASGMVPVINTVRQARHWLAAGGGRCHLMVDTGMNRLGLPMAELGEEAVQALSSGGMIDALMSHYCSADEDVALNGQQRDRLARAAPAVAHRRRSLSNSAGIFLDAPGFSEDLTRPGIALYGGWPSARARGIRPVAAIEAAILQTRALAAGDTVGYNATFTAPRPMRVGVVSLGYADGYLRAWSNGAGAMLHGDMRLPVLGRVSMDMTVIDLSAAPELQEGDWVRAAYELGEASRVTGLSQYELLTLLGRRLARIAD